MKFAVTVPALVAVIDVDGLLASVIVMPSVAVQLSNLYVNLAVVLILTFSAPTA